MWLILGVMAVYSSFTLLVLGYYFDRFATEIFPSMDPVVLVNRYLLAAFVSLFFIRFLFQKMPRMKVVPYLHLPIRRRRLVLFFQATSLLSVHNIYPMLFFIPFWIRFVFPSDMITGNIFWIISVVGVLGGSHFANLYLRSVLKQRSGIFYLLMILFILVTVVDETAGLGMIQNTSAYLFDQVLGGDLSSFGLLLSINLAMAGASTMTLLRSLNEPHAAQTTSHVSSREIVIPERFGITGRLIYLELLLMWRNRRPRHYLIVSLLFSTMYLIFMLASRAFGGYAFSALIGLFASGGFALNYGQLMFSWDSTYFDGMLSRSISFRQLVRAKLLLLQGSCLLMFAISLPLFVWLRPDLVPLHLTFLIYNAGITTVLVMELATRNRQAVDIGRSGNFFNYEGLSAKHWLWFIPTALPPTLFMAAMSDYPGWGLTVLAFAGFSGLLSTDLFARYFARGLQSRKYRMAAGFRLDAS